MDSKQFRHLLDLYFEGETSQEEEQLIRRFYKENETVAADLEKFRALFLYFDHAKTVPFPKAKSHQKQWMPYTIAASLLILIGLFLMPSMNSVQPPEENLDQAAVEKAYNDFKTNFTELSKHWEKGTTSVQYLVYWDQTTKEFIKK